MIIIGLTRMKCWIWLQLPNLHQGPIAVNGAIVVGYKLAGILGAMTAILGTIIPPFLIISVISVGYHSFRDSYIISQILEGMPGRCWSGDRICGL